MDSPNKDLTQISQKISKFCGLLDRNILETTPATTSAFDDFRNVHRNLNSISDVPSLDNVATKDMADLIVCTTRATSKQLHQLLDDMPLVGDAETRLNQLTTSPRLIFEVKDDAWEGFHRRMELFILCLRLVYAMLRYQTDSLEGKDVSHTVVDILKLYKKSSKLGARIKAVIYKEWSRSSSSESDSNLDSADSGSESGDDGPPMYTKASSEDKTLPKSPLSNRPSLSTHSDDVVAEAGKNPKGCMNKKSLLTMMMESWPSRTSTPKQTPLSHPHTCRISPTLFDVWRDMPSPSLRIMTSSIQDIQINHALFNENNVREALTWYFTFEFVKTTRTDKDWVQATVSFIGQADKAPYSPKCWHSSPDFVTRWADKMLANLGSGEPFAMLQWTKHSIKMEGDRVRVVFKRSVSILDDPGTTYRAVYTYSAPGRGVHPPRPPIMPPPSDLSGRGPPPPSPPPGLRIVPYRPRRRPLKVRWDEIELSDIPDLPRIRDENVLETLVKKYIQHPGPQV